MTAPLELRYRRLLAVYPADHRRVYEEEMVGVLMEGAEPGQRRPGLGEAADLLWSGFVARLGRGVQGQRGAGWRDAAGVAALIGVFVLAAVACRRLLLGVRYALTDDDPMRAFGIDYGLLADVAARSVAWLAVLIAVLLAARRTAVALGVVALLVEIAAIVVWLPDQSFRSIRMSWALALATLTLALLVQSRPGRTATAVLGRRGQVLIGAGLALAAVDAVTVQWAFDSPQILGLVTVTDALLLGAGALLLAGLQAIPAKVRRRTLVLLAPVAALPFAQHLVQDLIGIAAAASVTPGMVLTDVLVMVLVPAAAFVVAAAALHARENLTVSITRKQGGEAL